MRWLLVKDLQILRRSPLLVGLLVVYPVVIALMIGFALSSPPGKPKVAFYNQVPTGQGKISLGSQHINVAHYASELLSSVDPIRVHSRAEAVAKVRNGQALAAVVIPADLPQQIQGLVTQGVGSPSVELILNTKDPIERQLVDQAITTRINEVEQSVSKQILAVAVRDLQQVLTGGTVQILGRNVPLLGLRNARTIVQGSIAGLPPRSPLRAALGQVVGFADLAIEGLGFASPVLGTIGTPLTVNETQLAGRTTPSDAYAVAIAVVVSLMFVTVLLAAGLLALERSENAYTRLVRGLVSPGHLLAEKILLAA
ncbi:MAG TPA: ABC transporter permease, partial [Solirubrobacteraceae bacterium]